MKKGDQKGHIWAVGKMWYGRWATDETQSDGTVKRVQRSKALAEVGDRYRSKKDVQPILDEIIRELGEASGQAVDARATMPVATFIKNVYLPHAGDVLKPSTAYSYRRVFERYVKPYLEPKQVLRDFDAVDLTRLLDRVWGAAGIGRSPLEHVRTLFVSSFEYAKATEKGVKHGAVEMRA